MARRRSRWRSRLAKGDADDEGRRLRYPLRQERSLFLATRQAQQLAIAAVHQRHPRFDKANCPIAQVMGLPGSFGNAFRPEQTLSDPPIGGAVDSGVKRAQRQRESLSPPCRKTMDGWPCGETVERAPKTVRSMRSDVEVAIKRQFGGIRHAGGRRLSQPEPMLDPVNAQDSVPAVRRVSRFACG
jgi:hypothetical protein